MSTTSPLTVSRRRRSSSPLPALLLHLRSPGRPASHGAGRLRIGDRGRGYRSSAGSVFGRKLKADLYAEEEIEEAPLTSREIKCYGSYILPVLLIFGVLVVGASLLAVGLKRGWI